MLLHTGLDSMMKLTHTALVLLGLVSAANAQDAAAQDAPAQQPAVATATFTAEQLEQIVAPIALHPDALLSQIMMAATYPLEIVEAHRWVQNNASVTGKPLEEALKKQAWDPSVKSLCPLPSVLKQLNDNLDWTQDLGDAFLGQKAELMQTVQTMRKKALEAGTLKSSEQQKVREDGQIIIIESTTTEVVYVPVYSPTVVYGVWYYPYWYYPPMYVPPPPGAVLFAFGVGYAWGAGCWGGCNWHGNDVVINVNHYNSFNKNTSINPQRYNVNAVSGTTTAWNHNPEHRKGVNYKNPQTAQQYGAAPGSSRVTREQARGYDSAARGTAPAPGAQRTAPAAGTQRPAPAAGTQRPAAKAATGADTKRPATNGPKPSTGDGAGTGPKGTKPTTGASGGGLSGSRSPGLDRSASTRGATSRSGGGARPGGGRG